MDDIKIRQGSRFTFIVQREDENAVSATFIFSDGTIIHSKTVAYDVNGNAYFEIGSPDTDVVGVYEYQVNENFASGSPDIYPNIDGCDGDCDLPKLTICESLPETS